MPVYIVIKIPVVERIVVPLEGLETYIDISYDESSLPHKVLSQPSMFDMSSKEHKAVGKARKAMLTRYDNLFIKRRHENPNAQLALAVMCEFYYRAKYLARRELDVENIKFANQIMFTIELVKPTEPDQLPYYLINPVVTYSRNNNHEKHYVNSSMQHSGTARIG